MKPYFLSWLFFLSMASCAFHHARASENAPSSRIEIFKGARYFSYKEGKPIVIDNIAYTLKEKTSIHIQNIRVMPDPNISSLYEVHLYTDKFVLGKNWNYIVRCNETYFKAKSFMGNDGVMSIIVFGGLTKQKAELLSGESIGGFPKGDIHIDYDVHESYPLNSGVNVGIGITNNGKTPLDIYWETLGNGSTEYRDTQLTFSATLNNVPVAKNPNPKPDGYASKPHLFRPGSSQRRDVHLSDWLEFKNPGAYLVNVDYTLEIKNPEAKAGSVQSWKVTYHHQFKIEVTDKVE